MKHKTYYYHDLVNDDFAAAEIKTNALPDDYKYVDRNPLYLITSGFLRFIAITVISSMLRVHYLLRIKNKKVLKKVKGQGYFLYGNHTDYLLDAVTPSVISFPKFADVIVNPDAVSIKGIKHLVKLLGVIPIPTSIKGFINYKRSITKLVGYKHVMTIYPEAHIWPYYTDIRPFGTESFHYQAELGVPCFTFTKIYQKRIWRGIKHPKVTTYIDGPFYPDMNLEKTERIQKLRDEVYQAMKKRVDDNPKYEYVKYIYSNKKEVIISKTKSSSSERPQNEKSPDLQKS
jgi:1-acyl-sn-glycerol-3-phosphate acyltransferase